MRAWVPLTILACLACTFGTATCGVLPFRPINGPDEQFTASDLTMVYERDSSLFLNTDPLSYLSLDDLDRHGRPKYPEEHDGRRRVWSDPEPDKVTELSPEEKDAATTPTPGVQVGVPSYISVPGTLIGGAILLGQIIANLF